VGAAAQEETKREQVMCMALLAGLQVASGPALFQHILPAQPIRLVVGSRRGGDRHRRARDRPEAHEALAERESSTTGPALRGNIAAGTGRESRA